MVRLSAVVNVILETQLRIFHKVIHHLWKKLSLFSIRIFQWYLTLEQNHIFFVSGDKYRNSKKNKIRCNISNKNMIKLVYLKQLFQVLNWEFKWMKYVGAFVDLHIDEKWLDKIYSKIFTVKGQFEAVCKLFESLFITDIVTLRH